MVVAALSVNFAFSRFRVGEIMGSIAHCYTARNQHIRATLANVVGA